MQIIFYNNREQFLERVWRDARGDYEAVRESVMKSEHLKYSSFPSRRHFLIFKVSKLLYAGVLNDWNKSRYQGTQNMPKATLDKYKGFGIDKNKNFWIDPAEDKIGEGKLEVIFEYHCAEGFSKARANKALKKTTAMIPGKTMVNY